MVPGCNIRYPTEIRDLPSIRCDWGHFLSYKQRWPQAESKCAKSFSVRLMECSNKAAPGLICKLRVIRWYCITAAFYGLCFWGLYMFPRQQLLGIVTTKFLQQERFGFNISNTYEPKFNSMYVYLAKHKLSPLVFVPQMFWAFSSCLFLSQV